MERARIDKLLSSSADHLAQLRITVEPHWYLAAKSALLELFHSKCAYCESPLDSVVSNDVEHFRPKQGATDLSGKKEQHYYAWLALEWDNMLVACTSCNRRYTEQGRLVGKGSMFPVEGARAPRFASVADCRKVEKALLIDPCFDRPEDELTFAMDGRCLPAGMRGEVTIEVLNLNRPALIEARKSTWSQVQLLVAASAKEASSNASSNASPAADQLRDLMSGRLPYTAAARAAFAATARTVRDRKSRESVATAALSDVDDRSREQVQAASTGKQMKAAAPAPTGAVRRSSGAAVAPPMRYPGKTKLPRFAHQHVRRVEIHNFKAIEYIDVDFPDAPHGAEELAPATLLLGENACGKSTILEAVALTLLGTDLIGRLRLDVGEFVRRTDWEAPVESAEASEIAVYFSDASEPVRLTIDPKTKRFRGERRPSTVVLAYGPRRFFAEGRRRRQLPGLAEQVRTMFDPLAIIENPTRWLLDAPQTDFNAAVRALRQVLLMKDEAVVARPTNGARRGKQIMFEVQGDVAPLNRLSEGYKTIVAMSVDVMHELLQYWPDLESARGVVLIDELDTHLHPRWKMRIVRRLRRAMPHVQFIATTHDPLCLRGLNDGEAQVLHRDEEKRVEKLTTVPNVRGLSVEQLLTSEFFGLYSTEDPGLEDDVMRYSALATKRNRSDSEEQALAQQRIQVQQTITLGATPSAQLFHEAASEYLLQRNQAAASERPALKRAAIERVVNLWKSLDSGEVAS